MFGLQKGPRSSAWGPLSVIVPGKRHPPALAGAWHRGVTPHQSTGKGTGTMITSIPTAKKTAQKRLTRSGPAASTHVVEPAVKKTAAKTPAKKLGRDIESRELAAPRGDALQPNGAQAPAAKKKPGRKSNAQQADEVMERLIGSPAERSQFIDQLARQELIEKLVALRNEAGLSQRELAEKVGSHQPDVGKIETGKVTTVAALQRYARGCGARLVITLER